MEDASQVGLQNYWIEGGNLTIFTNPNTWGRTKIKTQLLQQALTPEVVCS
jgi:hypothetical protein